MPMPRQPLTDAGQAVEDLLPFHVAGSLSAAEARQVEAALAADSELRRRLALVEEEMTETILLNEGIAGPSTRALDRLMAGIEAEPARNAPSAGWSARLAGWFHAVTPRQAAWATGAVALVIALQAGALVGLATRQADVAFQTASQGSAAPAAAGAAFTVIFQPEAKAADIAALLERTGVRIVDGPRVGGIYRVVFGDKPLAPSESEAVRARLAAEIALVRMVAPAR
jgi:anti-sigma factor RsiW